MSRKHFKKMLRLFMAILVLSNTILSQSIVVSAENSESGVAYQNGMLVLIPDGKEGKNPDFFKEHTGNLIPGDIKTFTINLKNNSTKIINLFFWATDSDFGMDTAAKAMSDDLLSKIQLTIKLSGSNTLFYEGPANGKGNGMIGSTEIVGNGVSDGINLGLFEAGSSSNMLISIAVPTTLGNKYQEAIAAVDWVFLCQVYEETNPPYNPPYNPPESPEDDTIVIDEPQIPEAKPDVSKEDPEILIDDDKIPEGTIIIDKDALGKLPQTGIMATLVANNERIITGIFILFMGAFFIVWLRERKANKDKF